MNTPQINIVRSINEILTSNLNSNVNLNTIENWQNTPEFIYDVIQILSSSQRKAVKAFVFAVLERFIITSIQNIPSELVIELHTFLLQFSQDELKLECSRCIALLGLHLWPVHWADFWELLNVKPLVFKCALDFAANYDVLPFENRSIIRNAIFEKFEEIIHFINSKPELNKDDTDLLLSVCSFFPESMFLESDFFDTLFRILNHQINIAAEVLKHLLLKRACPENMFQEPLQSILVVFYENISFDIQTAKIGAKIMNRHFKNLVSGPCQLEYNLIYESLSLFSNIEWCEGNTIKYWNFWESIITNIFMNHLFEFSSDDIPQLVEKLLEVAHTGIENYVLSRQIKRVFTLIFKDNKDLLDILQRMEITPNLLLCFAAAPIAFELNHTLPLIEIYYEDTINRKNVEQVKHMLILLSRYMIYHCNKKAANQLLDMYTNLVTDVMKSIDNKLKEYAIASIAYVAKRVPEILHLENDFFTQITYTYSKGFDLKRANDKITKVLIKIASIAMEYYSNGFPQISLMHTILNPGLSFLNDITMKFNATKRVDQNLVELARNLLVSLCKKSKYASQATINAICGCILTVATTMLETGYIHHGLLTSLFDILEASFENSKLDFNAIKMDFYHILAIVIPEQFEDPNFSGGSIFGFGFGSFPNEGDENEKIVEEEEDISPEAINERKKDAQRKEVKNILISHILHFIVYIAQSYPEMQFYLRTVHDGIVAPNLANITEATPNALRFLYMAEFWFQNFGFPIDVIRNYAELPIHEADIVLKFIINVLSQSTTSWKSGLMSEVGVDILTVPLEMMINPTYKRFIYTCMRALQIIILTAEEIEMEASNLIDLITQILASKLPETVSEFVMPFALAAIDSCKDSKALFMAIREFLFQTGVSIAADEGLFEYELMFADAEEAMLITGADDEPCMTVKPRSVVEEYMESRKAKDLQQVKKEKEYKRHVKKFYDAGRVPPGYRTWFGGFVTEIDPEDEEEEEPEPDFKPEEEEEDINEEEENKVEEEEEEVYIVDFSQLP